MKRKVIQLAGKTLVVSLPHEWAKKNNIKKGQELEVEEKGETLTIGGRGEAQWISGKIDVSNTDLMLTKILAAHYKAGFDELEIFFNRSDELDQAKDVILKEFLGFDIIEHTRNMIRLKRISQPQSEEFHNMLRKIIFLVKGMAEDFLEAQRKRDIDFLKSIALRDRDVNRTSNFCRRILNRRSSPKGLGPMYYVVEQLEKIGDIFKDLCLHNLEAGNKFSKDSELVMNELISYLSLFENLLFDFSLGKIIEFGRKRNQLRNKIEAAYPKITKFESTNLFLLNHALESIYDLNGALMAINFINNKF